MMYLIGHVLTIFTSTQGTNLPYLIIEMNYFKTIMAMVVRHTLSLVQDPELRDPLFYMNSCCGVAMLDPQIRLLP